MAVSGGLKYTVVEVGVGWVGVLASDAGLLKITLPQDSAEEAELLLGDRLKKAARSDRFFTDLTGRLRSYFAGQRVAFDDRLDLATATTFQGEVWRLARLIPYGQTRSYGWLAQRLGKAGAGRAVGQALARNPLPVIVPCHRVVAKGGKLGGYSGGLARKKFLLRLESAAT